MNSYYYGPVWNAFSFTYASYAVFPRRALQSMPLEWQENFVALVDEMHDVMPDGVFQDYTVLVKKDGKFSKDPMRDYKHTGPLKLASRSLNNL